ncbi:MAG: hypothetical protein AB1762_06110 [Gemmatimonadota bacterium]
MLAPLAGCLSAQRGSIGDAIEKLPQTPPTASQPTENRIDADQLVGGIVAKIAPQLEAVLNAAITATFTAIMETKLEAKLDARLNADVNAQGIGTIISQFGPGVAACMMLTTLWLAITGWTNQRRWAMALKEQRKAGDAALAAERTQSDAMLAIIRKIIETLLADRTSVP